MTVSMMTMESPVGGLSLFAKGDALVAVKFNHNLRGWSVDAVEVLDHPVLVKARRELEAYFAGARDDFSVKLDPHGTAFQRAVWATLQTIPYGAAESYGWVAKKIGNPKAVRAVGLANGQNPIAIIIPCHRVIGSDGTLTGYGGGLDNKRTLLKLEGIAVKENR